jgi:arylformamidase
MSPLELFDGLGTGTLTLAVGADETPEFHRQAQIFVHTHGGDVMIVPGTHHMTVLNDLAAPDGLLMAEVRRRLRSL